MKLLSVIWCNLIEPHKQGVLLTLFAITGMALPLSTHGATRFWIGAGGSWSDTANWSESSGGIGNASLPLAGDAVIFDEHSGDCMIDMNVTVTEIRLTEDYSDTVQVTGANTLLTRDYIQHNGAFIGGTGTITFQGASSGGDFEFTQTGGTFTHLNGPAVFRHTANLTYAIEGSPEFDDLEFDISGLHWHTADFNIAVASTVTVHGALTFRGSSGTARFNTGTLEVHGDIVSHRLSAASDGWVVLRGSEDQVIEGKSAAAYLPNLRIDKPSGSAILEGTPMISQNVEHLAGDFNAATSRVTFLAHDQYNGTMTSAVAQLTFHDVRFWHTLASAGSRRYNLAPDLTLSVTNRLEFDSVGLRVDGGTIHVYGDMAIDNGSYHNSSALFHIGGTGDQTLSGTGGILPALTIDKPSGTLFLDGTLVFRSPDGATRVLDHIAGDIDAGTSLVHFQSGAGLDTMINSAVGQLDFYDLRFSAQHNWGRDITIENETLVRSLGTLSFGHTGLNMLIRLAGRLQALGDIVNQGGTPTPQGVNGTVLELVGDATQYIDMSGYEHWTRLSLQIDKDGGEVKLLSDLEMDQADRRLEIVSGVLNLGTNILTFSGNNTVYSNSPNAELRLTLGSDKVLIRQTGSGSRALINGRLFVERADGFETPPDAQYTILESVTAVDTDPPHAPFETDGRAGDHALFYDVRYNEGGNNIILANVRIPRGMMILFR